MSSSVIYILDLKGKVVMKTIFFFEIDTKLYPLKRTKLSTYLRYNTFKRVNKQNQKVLISRNYRGDLDSTLIDKFMGLLMEKEEEGNVSPIIQHGNVTFAYIKYNNLYC